MSGRLFKRNLAKHGQTITLQNRSIVQPLFGGVDFDERFDGDNDVQAIVKTIKGKTFFDGVNTESVITHELLIEFIDGVTAETWVLFKGRRLDVLNVINCCEEDEILTLVCNERGTAEASKI